MFAFQYLLKASYGFRNCYKLSLRTGELGRYEKGLGEKSLYLSGPAYGQFVFLGKLVHTENGNNVLQVFILLQRNLNRPCRSVMLFSQNIRIENAGSGIKRINGGIDA